MATRAFGAGRPSEAGGGSTKGLHEIGPHLVGRLQPCSQHPALKQLRLVRQPSTATCKRKVAANTEIQRVSQACGLAEPPERFQRGSSPAGEGDDKLGSCLRRWLLHRSQLLKETERLVGIAGESASLQHHGVDAGVGFEQCSRSHALERCKRSCGPPAVYQPRQQRFEDHRRHVVRAVWGHGLHAFQQNECGICIAGPSVRTDKSIPNSKRDE
mmetsp:Transcript_38208/g.109704  ORF Transcript_38208/g.109704 Transcript_38208/m.109704 type:complete len:214 (-) Transcript_38208:387-1028(-)